VGKGFTCSLVCNIVSCGVMGGMVGVSACVCEGRGCESVCVCVREREREREVDAQRGREGGVQRGREVGRGGKGGRKESVYMGSEEHCVNASGTLSERTFQR
jgi:hypothetical protein